MHIWRFSIDDQDGSTTKITLPYIIKYTISTKIDFAENQLSPRLISLSPLTIIQIKILQHLRHRSLRYYSRNLIIVRSRGFGSHNSNFIYLHYALKLATIINSLVHYTKGTLVQYALTVFRVKFRILRFL